MANKATLKKKISPATVCPEKLRRLDVALAGDKDGKPPKEISLYDVYGVVTGFKKSKPDAERSWIGFTGNFEAVVAESGEIIQSGTVFVHNPITDMLYGALMMSEQTSEEGAGSVQFALRVSIVPPANPNKPSATGYEFKLVSLVDSEVSSPLAAIRENAKKAIAELDAPRLAAPVPDPTPGPIQTTEAPKTDSKKK